MAGFTSANDKFAVVGTHNGAAYATAPRSAATDDRTPASPGRPPSTRGCGTGMNSSIADYAGGHYANGVYERRRRSTATAFTGSASATDGFGYGVWGLTSSPTGSA